MAMLRSAVRTTPGAWYTSEAVRVAVQRTMRDCEREVRSNTEAEIADWLAPVCKAMGRNPSRNPPSIEELCRYAVEHLAPGA